MSIQGQPRDVVVILGPSGSENNLRCLNHLERQMAGTPTLGGKEYDLSKTQQKQEILETAKRQPCLPAL